MYKSRRKEHAEKTTEWIYLWFFLSSKISEEKKKSIWMEKKRKIPRSKRQKYTNNQNRVIPKKKKTPPKGQMV